MKKLPLNIVQKIALTLYALGIIIFIIGLFLGSTKGLIVILIGLLELVGTIFFLITYSRCPHCGRFIRLYKHHCPHCGKYVDK